MGARNTGDPVGLQNSSISKPIATNAEGNHTEGAPAGFGFDNKDVKGSLKVHIKLDLEANIQIIARIKGDIAIGLL